MVDVDPIRHDTERGEGVALCGEVDVISRPVDAAVARGRIGIDSGARRCREVGPSDDGPTGGHVAQFPGQAMPGREQRRTDHRKLRGKTGSFASTPT